MYIGTTYKWAGALQSEGAEMSERKRDTYTATDLLILTAQRARAVSLLTFCVLLAISLTATTELLDAQPPTLVAGKNPYML